MPGNSSQSFEAVVGVIVGGIAALVVAGVTIVQIARAIQTRRRQTRRPYQPPTHRDPPP